MSKRPSNYDKFPFVQVDAAPTEVQVGWENAFDRIKSAALEKEGLICLECYPGVDTQAIIKFILSAWPQAQIIESSDFFRSPAEVDQMVAPFLGDDPVFGRMNGIQIEDFFEPSRLALGREKVAAHNPNELTVVLGVGASLLVKKPRVLVYADLARWEIQLRQRQGHLGNLGSDNFKDRPALKYKRAFFVDWRAADRLKKEILPHLDFLLDTHQADQPKLITGEVFQRGLWKAVHRPFRVVPFFDPGPWGGQWMKEVCGLPGDKPNYAWCFDCVPEENSLVLGIDDVRVEIPSIDLVLSHPRELLGEAVHARFGTEFPIRFDFLDTMDGGNLSLQVHPLTEFIHDQFGLTYTQDESYYILDAKEDATVYLGVKDGIEPKEMMQDLEAAQAGIKPFDDRRFINQFPAKKHDHFLIPAGTIHCSGKNSMVLEISATPFIFTFKLWDWQRMGLDGRPRPIHLDFGAKNIQWDRNTQWVKDHLVNRIENMAEGPGWREERTGLHEREFIETRRHWFTKKVAHHTQGRVNVLNLIEGDEAIVESPEGKFMPFHVHYAETFIVPAAVGAYTIRPTNPNEKSECATIKAYVRT